MKNSIKRAQSQACLNFAERKNFGLQAKYKILSLLVLLVAAVSGAWATEPTVYQSQEIYLSSLKQGDIILNGVTLKSPLNDRINFVPNRYTYNGQVSSAEAEFAEFPQTTGNDCNIANLVTPIDENGQPGNAWVVTNVENVNNMYYKVYIAGIQYEYPDAIVVTTNAAEEGAAFTEASFQMPGSDVTVEYELVRDMSVQMTAQVGTDPEAQPRYRVEKANENMYAPVDMSMDDVLALFTVNDDIEQKALTPQDYFCLIYPVDEEDKILEGAEDGVLLENFTFAPGRYAVRAIAMEESNYADTTALSNTFVLFEGYPVEVPAGEYVTFYKDKALTLLETETEAKLYTITEVSGDQAVLSEAIETAPALTPLLIYNGSEEPKTILLIPTEDPETELTWAPEFVGTLKDSVIAASSETQDNYALNGYAFVWVKNKINVAANKCWLTVAKDNDEGMEARSIRIVSGGEATGISGMSTKSGISGDWYDLNGRKLSKKPTKKGVYILNGKKVVVK